MPGREWVEFGVEVIAVSRNDKNVLLRLDDDEDEAGDEQWCPRSLIENGADLERGDSDVVFIRRWKAEQMGWA